MYCPADLLDPAAAVGFEFDADVEVRQHVEGRELVEQEASVHAVHAADDDVGLGHRPYHFGVEEITGEGHNLGTEPHPPDRPRQHLHLEFATPCVVHRG